MVTNLIDGLVPETEHRYEFFVSFLIKISEYNEELHGVEKAVKVLASHQKVIQTLAGRFREATRTVVSYYEKLTFYYMTKYKMMKKLRSITR